MTPILILLLRELLQELYLMNLKGGLQCTWRLHFVTWIVIYHLVVFGRSCAGDNSFLRPRCEVGEYFSSIEIHV